MSISYCYGLTISPSVLWSILQNSAVHSCQILTWPDFPFYQLFSFLPSSFNLILFKTKALSWHNPRVPSCFLASLQQTFMSGLASYFFLLSIYSHFINPSDHLWSRHLSSGFPSLMSWYCSPKSCHLNCRSQRRFGTCKGAQPAKGGWGKERVCEDSMGHSTNSVSTRSLCNVASNLSKDSQVTLVFMNWTNYALLV